jgi:hypothetical protein
VLEEMLVETLSLVLAFQDVKIDEKRLKIEEKFCIFLGLSVG